MQYGTFRGLARLVLVGVFVLLVSACNGSDESSSQALRNDNPLTLSGSIGDGPVADATVTVLDSHGQSVVAGVSDSAAGYEITVPVGTSFPITVTATGGTDLVSGLAPDFALKAALVDPTINHVNVSPFSSLALAIADCGGAVNARNLTSAWTVLGDRLGMGMDRTRVPDPTNGVIDASNVADVVLANEALGETLRRAQAALEGTSGATDAATLVERLGCDLSDGVIDGAGGNADVRTAATFTAASAGVMLELIAGTLQVNGSDAMGPMDSAIQTVMPGVDPSVTTLKVPVSDSLVKQAADSLAVVMGTLPDDMLLDYAALLGSTTAADARAALQAALTSGDTVTLGGLATRVAAADDTDVATVTEALREQPGSTPPVVSLAATPTAVTAGGSVRLSWSSNGATRCKASGDWNGRQPTEGATTFDALQSNKSYKLQCVGLGGTTTSQAAVQVSGSTSPPTSPPPSAPVTTLTANPTSVAKGGASTLTWSATNAASCVASGGWSGTKAVSGTQSVGPLNVNSSYSLACTGAGGSSSATATVLVQQPAAAPTLNFAASPLSVASGGSSTLTWSSTNATSCVASGDWTGTKSVSGSSSTGALTAGKTYTLACTGAGGTVTRSASVALSAPSAPTLTFTASPTSVQSGAASQLTWSTTNTTSCNATGSWTGTKATSGTQSTGPLSANASYTMTCTGAGGSVSQTAPVTILTAPTLTFSASPTGVASGSASQLTWTSTDATACTASGSWTGAKATSGTQSSGALTSNGSYTLTCSGSGGSVARSATVTVLPAPTVTIAASPTSIASGSASQLTWSSTNATSCTASGGWAGGQSTSGTQSTGALTANASYTLTCSGTGGTASQTASVSVAAAAPTVTLTASPTSVASGSASQLTWSSTNATNCTASGGWSGGQSTSGTQSTGVLTANASYTLTCSGTGGTASQTASVSVAAAAAPTVTFTASPTTVTSGSASQLTWSSTNATSCTASGGWSGSQATSGTQSTGALTANASYTLTCTGAGGSASQTAPVAVAAAAAPTLTFTASPTSVASGSASQLTWSSTNATSCTASGSWSGSRATSGTLNTGALTTSASYTLTCSGSGGSIAQTATVSVSAAAPTLTLTASPTSVQSGNAANLTWSTTNATSCTASGAWTGAKGTSGTQSTGALTSNSSFTLACAGAGGNIAQTASVSVTAGTPSVTLSASPPGVARNGSAVLAWSGTNVTTCTASGGWTGTKATTGSESVGPITADSTYSLNCSGAGGSAVAMTTVSLREAVLTWQAPTKNTDGSTLSNLSGYKVYYGTSSKNYSQSVSVTGASTTTWTMSLAPGTYYFAMTAVDASGTESSKTNEVSKTVH